MSVSKRMIVCVGFWLANFWTLTAQENLPENDALGPYLTVQSGIYIPQGTLTDAMRSSPFLAIVASIPLAKQWTIDPAVTLFFSQAQGPIGVREGENVILGRISGVGGHFGVSFNRVEKLGRRTFVEARAGTGFSFIGTNIKKENVPEESDDRYYGSETIFLQGGVGIKVFAFRYSYIGLELNYYYTPYNLFKKNFSPTIGNQALSIGISYGF